MDNMPILAVILQSIPESIIIINLAMSLIEEKVTIGEMILIATLAAIASYIIRLQHMPFGIHSTVTILFLLIFTKVVTKKKLILLLLGLIPALVFYGVLELSLLPWMLKLTGLNLNYVLENTLLRIVFPIPLYLICIIAMYILRKTKWSIVGDFKHSL
jgi:hypothetical protein